MYWLNTVTGEKSFDKDKPVKTISKAKAATSSSNVATSMNKGGQKRKQHDIDPLDFTGGRVSTVISNNLTCNIYF